MYGGMAGRIELQVPGAVRAEHGLGHPRRSESRRVEAVPAGLRTQVEQSDDDERSP